MSSKILRGKISYTGGRKMGKRSVSIAWKVLLVYGLYTIILGLILLVAPREFAVTEFESFTGAVWAEFAEANAKAANFIEFPYRAMGCMVLLLGIYKIFIALRPYRRAEAWSWWAILISGVIVWSYMFSKSAMIGNIGDIDRLAPNILGIVIFLVAIVLPARAMLGGKAASS